MAELLTLSRPYARAAFTVARGDSSIGAWAEALSLLEALAGDTKVQALLDSPRLDAGQKTDALLGLLGDGVDPKIGNFLQVLAQNKRLALLPTIKVQFFDLKNQYEKAVEVDITTAYEISDAVRTSLIAALTKKLERDVELTSSVDPKLLGGALIRAGDTVIDGSVKGRLAKLAEAMNS